MMDPAGDALNEWFDELDDWDTARADAMPGPSETLRYGDHPDQHIDIWQAAPHSPVVISIHGGYFLQEYDKTLHTPIARELSRGGFTVANVEYRRGAFGRAATIADVWAAVDSVTERFHPTALAVFGHSAGGYLAAILATHPSVDIVIPLAPVSDLAGASRAGWDDGGIAQWMGARPDADPDPYRRADLRALITVEARHVMLHGTADTAVGIEQSRSYAVALREADADVTYVELANEGHYGYLDPRESAFDALLQQLRRWRDGA